MLGRGSPNIEMDEHTFLVNRERAVDYLCSLEKVPFINSSTTSGFLGRNFHPSTVTARITLVGLSLSDFLPPSVDYWQESTLPSPSLHLRYNWKMRSFILNFSIIALRCVHSYHSHASSNKYSFTSSFDIIIVLFGLILVT